MNVLKESAELQQLWEAMDTVIGETPVSPVAEHAAPAFDDNVEPILDRIERREKQRRYAATSGA